MTDTMKNYNALVPLMNNLQKEGYPVYEKCDRNMGYGFYAEGKNGYYVDAHIWGKYINVSLIRHCTLHGHDVLNDVRLKRTVNLQDAREVEEVVRRYLQETEGFNRQYQVFLGEAELLVLIDKCSSRNSDASLKEKLEYYLQKGKKEV